MDALNKLSKLNQKLFNIMSKIDSIEKDKTNTFHKYDYASEAAIKKVLHGALVEEKVLFRLGASNLRKEGEVTHVDFNYTFTDVDSGEMITDTFVGTGEDKGDKGTYKAITGAIKYILTSTFLIPTGDDPEKSPKPPTTPNQSPHKQAPVKQTSEQAQCVTCDTAFIPKGTWAKDCLDCYKKNNPR